VAIKALIVCSTAEFILEIILDSLKALYKVQEVRHVGRGVTNCKMTQCEMWASHSAVLLNILMFCSEPARICR